jgi:hypothetical protein
MNQIDGNVMDLNMVQGFNAQGLRFWFKVYGIDYYDYGDSKFFSL